MGTAKSQGEIWSVRARDWAEIQECVAMPVYESVLNQTKVSAGMSVLDIGCGSGLFCSLAAQRGAIVSGMDASDSLIEIAKERVPAGDFSTGEMEELPYPDKSFDIVAGFNSFQFAANPVNALLEASRVSKSGRVVIAVFAKPEESGSTAYIKALGSLLPPPPPGSPGPFALSGEGALEKFAAQAGLKPIIHETVACPWNYADDATALRGLLSSGPAIRAIQMKGEDVVKEHILKTLGQFRLKDGTYSISNYFQFLIVGK